MNLIQWIRRLVSPREVAPALSLTDRLVWESGPLAGPIPHAEIDAMLADPMIQSALTVKQLGLLSAPGRVVPANDSPRARRHAEFIAAAFDRMSGSPLDILRHATDAFARGWSLQELIFEPINDVVWLREVKPKAVESFGLLPDAYGNLRAITHSLPGEATRQYAPEKFVIYRHRRDARHPFGQSDLVPVRPHFRAKQDLLHAWQIHLERHASPTLVGRYDRQSSPDETKSLFESLKRVTRSGAIVHPQDFSIDALPVDAQASRGFQDVIDFHNREIARAILGQTLTTDEGRRVGSLALGKVHLQVLLLQLSALRQELADTVMTEQVIRRLIQLNFEDRDIPRYEFDPVDVSAFATGSLT
ncbi:MAG: DUF935 family protein [Fimbriimonadaceae bacterium]|nr:DUF935 family protein [Fimbriimonadaceae bacterium]